MINFKSSLVSNINHFLLQVITYNIIFLILISTSIYGQQKSTIYGKVLSNKLKPLENVNISIINSKTGTTTDQDGHYHLLIERKLKQVELRFSFVGYQDTTIQLFTEYDSIQLNIALKPELIELPEFVFESSASFYHEKSAFFSDIEMWDSSLMILAQKSNYTKLIILDGYGGVEFESRLTDKFYKFYTDCFDNIHLFGKDSCQQVYYDGMQLHIICEYSLESFESLIMPCIGETEQAIMVEHKTPESGKNFYDPYHNQLKKFYFVNKKDNTSEQFYAAFDKAAYQISQSCYSEIISLYNRITPNFDNIISNGLWDGNMIKLCESMTTLVNNSELDMLISWYLNVEAKPVFCPAFIQNDYVYIFDFTNNELVSFDNNFQFIDSIGISFQNDRSWDKKVWIDKKSGHLYAVFEKNGFYSVGEINLTSGIVSQRSKVCKYPFPQSVVLYDGHAYSIYNQNHTGNIIKLKL